MDWVSFDEIKKSVPLEAVLTRYGIPLRRVKLDTLRGKCPLPTHTSDASGESFAATLSKGVGGAWACQSQSCIKARGRAGGNVLDFVAAMEKCSIRDAAIKLQTWFLVPAAGSSQTVVGKEPRAASAAGKEPEAKKVTEVPEGECEKNKPLTFTLQKIDPNHPYLTERGLTPETIQTFGVGYFTGRGSMSGRIVIPIHNVEGELLAYAGRSIDGTEPRYKFPAGFRKSLELFNLNRVRGELSVVLVEGFFDCMKVTQAGYPCVALMGSAMSKAQEDLLAEHFAEVVIMMDGDEAGSRATDDVSARLQERVFRVTTMDLDDGRQPDQLTEEEIRIEWAGP